MLTDKKTVIVVCVTVVIVVAMLTDCPLEDLVRYVTMLLGIG